MMDFPLPCLMTGEKPIGDVYSSKRSSRAIISDRSKLGMFILFQHGPFFFTTLQKNMLENISMW